MSGRVTFSSWRGASHKYHARPVTIDGEWFASTGEAKRYHELQLLQRAGLVHELVRQPSWVLHAGTATGEQIAVGTYRADFLYLDEHGNQVVEDFKGLELPLFRWKKRHMLAEYGIAIRTAQAS
jgi:hypothetical protein